MRTKIIPEVYWTQDFITLTAEMLAVDAYKELQDTTARGVIVVRGGHSYYYAYQVQEILSLLSDREYNNGLLNGSLTDVLSLREVMQSTLSDKDVPVPSIDTSWRENIDSPTVHRYVMIDRNSDAPNEPIAIGEIELMSPPKQTMRPASDRPTRNHPFFAPDSPASVDEKREEFSIPDDWSLQDLDGGEDSIDDMLDSFGSFTNEVATTISDEGTRPLRYPSIMLEGDLHPDASVLFHIDLLRKKDKQTHADALNVGTLTDDWKELPLTVVLSCPLLTFDDFDTSHEVTIRRNTDSIPTTIKATVSADAQHDSVFPVVATFFSGTRYCGMAQRMFYATQLNTGDLITDNNTKGIVVSEPVAKQPDLTVYITRTDPDKPSQLHWRVLLEKVPGLPAKLSAQINIGQDPAKQVSNLFNEFSQLEYGKHQKPIEAFGSRLWKLAPDMFHDTYWVLCDALQRQLIIQFITDDPHIPWEIMRPIRDDESEFHPPLIMKHAVARWIERYEGNMRNQFPYSDIYTIAPKYKSHSRQLPRAQEESQSLVESYQATLIEGSYKAVNDFFESSDADIQVGILHFAGHGEFSSDVATASVIKLQDGELRASEIARPEVSLGKRCQTLVFFNACEVGNTGSVLGEIGGWADAFLGRQFGGFIAPLWSVDDADAGVVADELMKAIYINREPIGVALQGLRAKHGATSPTFYSYLYYGDVTAQLAPSDE